MFIKLHASKKKGLNSRGFTLVELLITIVVSSFIVAAIYSAYQVNQRHHTAQTQVIEMQQNIRAAMYIMQHELRMAGYDPTGSANAGFVTATAGRLRFTKDTTDTAGTAEDGDGELDGPNENITFGFSDDADNNGIPDSGTAQLGISYDGGGTYSAIADNIDLVRFLYTLEDASGAIIQTTTPTTAQLDEIRSVTVSIIARAANSDSKFTNSMTYTLSSGSWTAPGDNFRRRLLTANINSRNMGL